MPLLSPEVLTGVASVASISSGIFAHLAEVPQPKVDWDFGTKQRLVQLRSISSLATAHRCAVTAELTAARETLNHWQTARLASFGGYRVTDSHKRPEIWDVCRHVSKNFEDRRYRRSCSILTPASLGHVNRITNDDPTRSRVFQCGGHHVRF